MENNDFDFHINRLKSSPAYSMSLGSKELFHSNFWAYLIKTEEFRGLINAFFEDFDLAKYSGDLREDKHRDLTIRDTEGKEYVIENKIKSYPDKNQLIKYSAIGNFQKGAITGIKEPPFSLDNWNFVSYSRIASKLREINKGTSSYLNYLVNDYCDILDSINALMNMALEEKEGYLSYWSERLNKLYEVNLMDVFRKIKADDFVKTGFGNLKSKYDDLASTRPNTEFYIERSFNNCKATISFGFRKMDEYKAEQETIGIQIEDNQFRLFKWNRGLSAEETFEKNSSRGWFDATFDKKTNRKIKGIETKMTKTYCKYGDGWIYQYFDTWIEGREVNYQRYEDVAALLDKYLYMAFGLLS